MKCTYMRSSANRLVAWAFYATGSGEKSQFSCCSSSRLEHWDLLAKICAARMRFRSFWPKSHTGTRRMLIPVKGSTHRGESVRRRSWAMSWASSERSLVVAIRLSHSKCLLKYCHISLFFTSQVLVRLPFSLAGAGTGTSAIDATTRASQTLSWVLGQRAMYKREFELKKKKERRDNIHQLRSYRMDRISLPLWPPSNLGLASCL